MDFDEIDSKLTVYFIIKSLLENKLLSNRDIKFMRLHLDGYSFKEISNMCNSDRRVVRTSIHNSLSLIKQSYENEIMCNM